jgi:hypothetical protein
MKINYKFTSKKILFISYILVIIINVVIIMVLGQFINNKVYHSIFVDPTYIESQRIKTNSSLNIKKIQSVYDQINAKTKRGGLIIKNVF